MPIIKKLSQQETQKIAAGEVIERPASIVKELMENSIDAGATTITVTIEESGKKFISCVDNGCGMDPIDARTCIEAHATSKISCLDDLFALQTFGFRGEALNSLAVSGVVHIITKNAENTEAIYLVIKNGAIVSETVVAHQTGTTIEIHELFKALPVRLKFLKKDETEQRHIIQLFNALCLAHSHIHAKLTINGTLYGHYPAVKSRFERAQQIIAPKTDNSLLEVKYSRNNIVIEGAISTHQVYRFDKNNIYLFVNNRWVKNIGLSRAVMRAYTVLPQGKFPVASIHIFIDPATIDVNIHPRKEEVAFEHNTVIENALTQALKETLEKATRASMPAITTPLYQPYYQTQSLSHSIIPMGSVIRTPYAFNTNLKQKINIDPFKSSHLQMPEEQIPEKTADAIITQRSIIGEERKKDEPESVVLGQLDKTYIIAITENGLTLIDQHAAHERILYEQYASGSGYSDSVHLLFPEIIQLSSYDCTIVIEYQELLKQHGIITELFGANQIRVTALPTFTKHIAAQEIITALISSINYDRPDRPVKPDAHLSIVHALRAQIACKAAVKAGDTLTMTHMQQLIKDLANVAHNLTCPHGRPTYWKITLAELEKRFQRTM